MAHCLICDDINCLYVHGVPLCSNCNAMRIAFSKSHGLNFGSFCSFSLFPEEQSGLSSAAP